MPDTWTASGRHIIRADADERKRVSVAGPVYLGDGDVTNDDYDRKLDEGASVVIDQTIHLYAEGVGVVVEDTDEKPKPKSKGAKK